MKTLIAALSASLISLSAFAGQMTYTAPISSELQIDENHADIRQYVGGDIAIIPAAKQILLTQAPCTGICTMEIKAPKIFNIVESKKDEFGVVTYVAREVPNEFLPSNQALPLLTVTDYSRAQDILTIHMADTVIEYSTNVLAKGTKPKTSVSTLIAMRLETIR